MIGEYLISIDIEADGPIPGEYSMLSLGACGIDDSGIDDIGVDDLTRTFYRELQPISEQWQPEALAVSGLDRELLVKTGQPAVDAMRDFTMWLKDLKVRPVAVTFSTWDWVFLHWYFIKYTGANPFGHSSLDMKSYYMGKYNSTWRETAKSRIAKDRPILLDGLPPHTHNALDDAREQAIFFRRMVDHFPTWGI